MAQIKLIATDLDGTFLQGGDTPHPENIQAVNAHALILVLWYRFTA